MKENPSNHLVRAKFFLNISLNFFIKKERFRIYYIDTEIMIFQLGARGLESFILTMTGKF